LNIRLIYAIPLSNCSIISLRSFINLKALIAVLGLYIVIAVPSRNDSPLYVGLINTVPLRDPSAISLRSTVNLKTFITKFYFNEIKAWILWSRFKFPNYIILSYTIPLSSWKTIVLSTRTDMEAFIAVFRSNIN
jgi:hypothetical protein